MAPPLFQSPPTSSAQYAQQFLSTALSQRGPSALPYSEDSKYQIRHHLVSLTSTFPSLHPKTSSFTHNDGRTLNLLMADGTIPINYHNHLYNIPASIWLLEHYPRHPPSVFLTPTANMVVKPNHPYVDRNGLVHVPYLRNWVFPSSNLADLVRSLAELFSQDPPLYTTQNPNPSPSPSAGPAPNPGFTQPGSSRLWGSLSSLSPYPSRIPMQQQVQEPGLLQQQQQHRPMEDPAEVYRRNAMNKILDSVHGDIASSRKTQEAEMEGLFNTQATLRQRGEELSKGLREMVEEKEGLEQQLQLVLMNTDVLEGWVRENEGKKRRDFAADDVFEPSDVYSRQMMECAAADLAVEDTVYSLDKAAQEGSIPFNMYLKSVRALSREQFFHRALAAKVRAQVQMAQVAAMAARARPQYAP